MLATFADRMRDGAAQEERKRARAMAEASGQTTEQPATWQGVDLANAEPAELEAVLSDTILKAFRERLTRMGVEYQTPLRP
jgi:hypothetical protein